MKARLKDGPAALAAEAGGFTRELLAGTAG
jgi:hypothetical protein